MVMIIPTLVNHATTHVTNVPEKQQQIVTIVLIHTSFLEPNVLNHAQQDTTEILKLELVMNVPTAIVIHALV
jgi:hypothetical protein